MVPDEVNPNAKVIVVAQNPGADEERGQRFVRWGSAGGEVWERHPPSPLIGKSGHDLERSYLPLAGLSRADVECRNVIRCRVRGSNELPPLTGTQVRDAIRFCQRAYWRDVPEGAVLVALGAYSLWALTGEFGKEGAEEDDDDARANRGIDGWRGWVLPYRPVHGGVGSGEGHVQVFATWHPAYFYRAHWLKPVGKMDWARLGRVLGGRWPEPTPAIIRTPPTVWPSELAFDCEYYPDRQDVLQVRTPAQQARNYVSEVLRSCQQAEASQLSSLAAAAHWDEVLAVLSRQARVVGVEAYFEGDWDLIRRVLEEVRVADGQMRHLWGEASGAGASGISIVSGSQPRDQQVPRPALSQLQHWVGALSRLNLDTAERYQVRDRLIRWSVAWRDPDGTPHVHVVEQDSLDRFPINTPGRVTQHNAEADTPFLKAVFGREDMEWDDTMQIHSVLYGTWRHTLDFLGSLYARTNRWKHLEQSDPIVYAGLDALGTWDCWRALQRELARDRDSELVYHEELKPLLKHLMRRPAIRVATDRVAAAVEFYGAKQKEALARGQAAAGWPIKITSADQTARWLGIKTN